MKYVEKFLLENEGKDEKNRFLVCNSNGKITVLCAQLLNPVRLFGTPWTVATRLFCPWDFQGKNTGAGCHFFLQGTFPTQGSNPCLLYLRHWQADSLPLCHLGSPVVAIICSALSAYPFKGNTHLHMCNFHQRELEIIYSTISLS